MKIQVIQFLIFFTVILAKIYYWGIFFYIIMSWFPSSGAKFRGILAQIVEPVIRLFAWAKMGNLSFSAIIAFILIDYLGRVAVSFLSSLL